MKICVYAICKNESKNIKKWVKSMKEADEIYVLDTGSTDNSVKLLKSLKVNVVSKIIEPFRFDIARNESLKLVPDDTDLYVCTDLDETFNVGWRRELEKKYQNDYSRVSYLYNWSFKKDGTPGTTFYLNKIHTKDYTWVNPVHEVLKPLKEEKIQTIENIVLNHHQLYKKERSNYLKLLELSIKENPLDDRNMHYLGREYMYYKKYSKCIETLHKHLKLKNATWKDERSASMRFIARCYMNLEFYEESKLWYEMAIKEAPYLRENYVEYAFLLNTLKDYITMKEILDKAFEIKEKSITYINEEFAWNYQIYELYAIALYYLNQKELAKEYYDKALELNPNEKRLIDNKIYFQ